MAITLIPPEFREKGRVASRISRAVSKTTSIALVVYLVIFISFAGFFAFQFIRKTEFTNQILALQTDVTNLKDREATLFVLKNRVGHIAQISQKDSPFPVVMTHVLELIGRDTDLSLIDVSSSQNTVNASIQAEDSFALERFISSLSGSKTVKSVILENFNRSPEGTYIASFILEI